MDINYYALLDAYQSKTLKSSYVTADGEPMFVRYNVQEDKTISFEVNVHQSNGWIRKKYFYADGTTEELFERRCSNNV